MGDRVAELQQQFDHEAAGSSSARKLKPIAVSELVDLDLPAPEEVLGALIRPGTQMMVHGPAGVGKTYFLLGVGTAVQHRVDFLGWRASKSRVVLYVDGEMNLRELQQRNISLREPIHATIDHSFVEMYFVTPDLQDGPIAKIDTPEGQTALLALIDSIGNVELLILDNLSCLTAPEEDNATSSWSAVQELLLTLRRRAIACIVGHHSGKNGLQRGTSRRTDILDVVVRLTPVADSLVDGRTRVQVEFEKARALTADLKQPFMAVLESHPAGGLSWSRTAASVPIGDRARQMLLDGMPPGEIAAELHAARSFVYRIRENLIESGELAAANQKRGRKLRGQTANAAEIVPLSPSLRRGQGTKRHSRQGDKSGDNEGTQGTNT